jgi:hypothetical protein
MSQIPFLPNIFRLTRGLRGSQCEHQAKERELVERGVLYRQARERFRLTN